MINLTPYKRKYRESIEDNAVELAEEIQKEIQKIFPKSGVSVKFTSNLIPSISIMFTLGKDKTEYTNGIINNDPAFIKMNVYGQEKKNISDTGNIIGILILETGN